jgi:hypothetical protein
MSTKPLPRGRYDGLVRSPLAIFALLLVLNLPFLGKPVHIDDANFLVLAEGAARDPWRPHAIPINWQGRTEAAFDVLSNPPGVAWLLAPLRGLPLPLLHLWVMLWLYPCAWGLWQLGQRWAGRGAELALLVGCSPLVMLAAQSFTPDLPLLACAAAGLGGLGRPGEPAGCWPWAMVLGAAALFRYSGAALIPLAPLLALLLGARAQVWRWALAAALPLALLGLHDMLAYGRWHVLAMTGFQAVAESAGDRAHRLLAAVAMLGGAGLLPLLARGRGAFFGLGAGALAGLAGAMLLEQGPAQALPGLLAAAAGGAVLGTAATLEPDPARRWLQLWLLLGLLFFLQLRFMAGRYWLPFLPAAALLLLRGAPARRLPLAICSQALLGVALCADDQRFARAVAEAGHHAAARGEQGAYSGHWGFQHVLAADGWRAVEEDEVLPPGILLATSAVSWPQPPAEGCREPLEERAWADRSWGPRVHSRAGAANLHASWISGDPPLRTFAPWTFADDPYELLRLERSCRP